ncbi:MAG: 3-deoxy-D-manno-octulosonic acid transferase [Pyrinomonadaceae bacterium]
MFLIYSLLLTLAFILMSPLFLLRREKYAAGFQERLGNYPKFVHDGRKVIWLHCVSVGETNAARPLVDEIKANFPHHRLIVSTTTKTGQELAQNIFKDKADAVFYFPFDWKFSVRRALRHFKPDIVLLMETEIWFNFFHEAHKSGAKLSVVNGRLSERSANRYSYIKSFISRVLTCVDLALMQGNADAERIVSLGIDEKKVQVTGNLKFDHNLEATETALTDEFRTRFAICPERPLIVAASTHEPEEQWLLDAFCDTRNDSVENPRLLIAPRHPERFEKVAAMIQDFLETNWPSYTFARRSGGPSDSDKFADVILLDSIGELRAVYPLAEIVFVGGSLIPHGGQSILEPAAAGKAIVTGPHTHNFESVVKELLARNALIRVPETPQEFQIPGELYEIFTDLLGDVRKRRELGKNALAAMNVNRGATAKTINYLLSHLRQFGIAEN